MTIGAFGRGSRFAVHVTSFIYRRSSATEFAMILKINFGRVGTKTMALSDLLIRIGRGRGAGRLLDLHM